jgi:hypothetical protein
VKLVYRGGDRLELDGGRVIVVQPIPGHVGRHRLVCGTCEESRTVRELFDGAEGFARQWIATHETCEKKQQPVKVRKSRA